MKRSEIAWRGFVTEDLEVVAWPTLLSDHNNFHRTFMTSDSDFVARWRQWGPGEAPDFDPGATVEEIEAVVEWLP